MVIGGGGGLSQPLRRTNHRRNIDREILSHSPHFSYVVITPDDDTLKTEIHGLDRHFKEMVLHLPESFSIPSF
jgi:hypothetical protein